MSEAGPTGQQPTRATDTSGTFPSGSGVNPEAAAALVKPRRQGRVVSIVLFGVALTVAAASLGAALVFRAQAVEMQGQVEALKSQQAELSAQQATLDAKLSSLTEQFGQLEASAGVPLATYLEGLSRDVASAEATAKNAYVIVDNLSRRTDRVVECINTYMKTVGDSRGGYYQYFFCQ